LCTPEISHLIPDWHVHQRSFASDHNAISFTLKKSFTNIPLFRDYKNIDWQLFAEKVEKEIQSVPKPNIWTPNTIDKESDLIIQKLINTLNEFAPLKQLRERQNNPWFTSELKNKMKQMRRIHNKTKSGKATWDEFRIIRKEYKTLLKKTKHQAWKQFTDETKSPKEMAKLVKIAYKDPIEKLSMLQKKNGELTKSFNECIDLLLNEHFPDSNKIRKDNNTPHNQIFSKDPIMLNNLTPWINKYTVEEAFKRMQSKKAPGFDGIQPIVFQNLTPKIFERISNLFKACLELTYSPKNWRTSKVIFIPKPGKNSYDKVRSFRPISLTPVILKALERLVLWQLEKTDLKRHPLHANQYAFRKGRSTEMALNQVITILENAKHKKHHSLVVFLDLKGAFDNVSYNAIIKYLTKKNINENIIHWYINLLSERYCISEQATSPKLRELKRGIPQGGILSPIIWNLIFDDLIKTYDKTNIKCTGYADDACLIVSGQNIPDLESRMNEALQKASNWASSVDLEFSSEKTISLLISGDNTSHKTKIVMENKLIIQKHVTKYLGITIDDKLSWTPHIKSRINLCKRKLMSTKAAWGKTWGPHPWLTRWAWTGMIRPILSYGSFIWSHEAKKHKKELQKLQRLALMQLGHFRYSTPTASLEIISGVIPLHIWTQMESLNTLWRFKAYQDKNIQMKYMIPKRIKCINENFNKTGLNKLKPDLCVPIQMDSYYHVNTDSFNIWKPNSSNNWEIYTDGSLIKDHAGIGFIIRNSKAEIIHSESKYLGTYTSIFQAELTAITLSVIWILEHERHINRLNIFCDSQAAIKALNNRYINSETVKICKEALNRLGRKTNVQLNWIKGHNNHEMNERVDKLAKLGTIYQKDKTCEDKYIFINKTQAKKMIKELSYQIWNEEWIQLDTCRQTKIFLPELNITKSKKLIRYPRETFSLMTRFITGHNFLKSHESKMNNQIDPKCRCCQEKYETSSHIILNCPQFARSRYSIFGHLTLNPNPEWTPESLQKFLRNKYIQKLENTQETNLWGNL
jgi:ribonuclease HI